MRALWWLLFIVLVFGSPLACLAFVVGTLMAQWWELDE